MRTEVEVAADVLFILRSKNLLSKAVMGDACRAVGVSQDDLLAALRRSQQRGDRLPPTPGPRPTGTYDPKSDPTTRAGRATSPPPERPSEPEPPAPPPPPPPAPRAPSKPKYQGPTTRVANPTRRRERREIDGVPHLHCPRCERWLPEEEQFLMRSDRNARVTYCRDCRKTYHRERRVTAKVLDAMDRVGVQFVLDAESNLIGVACAKCGKAFTENDRVEGEFAPVHDHCSEKS